MFTKQTAVRDQVKLMVGLAGPSGSGKTLSALKMAYGICGDWKKIVLADTENKSALYYAGQPTGDWQHIDFNSDLPNGYHPDNWIKLIEYVEADPDAEVLILDSMSHEWMGKGGCLELNTKLGGRYTDWAKVTPLHNRFIDKIRNSRLNVIATFRTATDYVIDQNDKGKPTPRKVGLKISQRDGTDYEFGIMFDIDIKHFCEVSKDRTGLFTERGPFQITQLTGAELKTWCTNTPKEPAAPKSSYDNLNVKHAAILLKQLTKLNVPAEKHDEIGKRLHGKNLVDLEDILKEI